MLSCTSNVILFCFILFQKKDEIVITFKKPIEEYNLKVILKHDNGDCKMASLVKLNDKTFKFSPESK